MLEILCIRVNGIDIYTRKEVYIWSLKGATSGNNLMLQGVYVFKKDLIKK